MRQDASLKYVAAMALAAVLGVLRIGPGYAVPGPPSKDRVAAVALQWFAEMRAGKIDRAELNPDYSARLTPDAVQGMSHYLKEYQYGVSPLAARVILSRKTTDQEFYVVKLVFPRGDAASLLFGFDTQGRITGVSLMSMAGD